MFFDIMIMHMYLVLMEFKDKLHIQKKNIKT